MQHTHTHRDVLCRDVQDGLALDLEHRLRQVGHELVQLRREAHTGHASGAGGNAGHHHPAANPGKPPACEHSKHMPTTIHGRVRSVCVHLQLQNHAWARTHVLLHVLFGTSCVSAWAELGGATLHVLLRLSCPCRQAQLCNPSLPFPNASQSGQPSRLSGNPRPTATSQF
eukprot:1159301-Pelagomonas_calceolata.AAC.7